MIVDRNGDMFSVPADVRVNTVNCIGVMGKGVAPQFKKRYPDMFSDYVKACSLGIVWPGYLHVWTASDGTKIVNFPTKRHWKDNSRYDDIADGLKALKQYLDTLQNPTVVVPALGCGNGKLEWTVVKPMMCHFLKDVHGTIYIFPPISC